MKSTKLLLILIAGMVSIFSTSCSLEQPSSQAESNVQGAISGSRYIFTAPKPKSAAQLVHFQRTITTASRQIKVSATRSGSPRHALRHSIFRGIIDIEGIPRGQIKPTLTSLVAPHSRACDGVSCSRVFGLEPKDVDSYLDESLEIAAKDDVLAQKNNEGSRRLILSSLTREDNSPYSKSLETKDAVVQLATVRKKADLAAQTFAYGFASTGCDYRAFYLAMELASEGIAPKAVYNSARTGFKLMPTSAITWEYHVATTITVHGQEFVVDPTFKALGLASDSLLSKDEWFKLSGVRKQAFWGPSDGEEPYREFYFPGSFSLLENLRVREQGSTVHLQGAELTELNIQQQKIRNASFDETPSFTIKDINEACRSMTFLLHKENPASIAAQSAIIQRTEHLISQLDALGKITHDAIFKCSTR